AVYALLLMVPCLILALRLARLSSGMTLNGVLYQRLMREQDFTKKATPESMERAGRINVFGVSFLMFTLAAVIAAFSSLPSHPAVVGAGAGFRSRGGGLTGAAGRACYGGQTPRPRAFAVGRAAAEPVQPFGREEWEAHTAGSLEDANHDMITVLALVGLIVF